MKFLDGRVENDPVNLGRIDIPGSRVDTINPVLCDYVPGSGDLMVVTERECHLNLTWWQWRRWE